MSATFLRPGQLTDGWRWVLAMSWVGVAGNYAVAGAAAWTIGKPTWWLGPQVSPRPVFVMALPFVIAAVVVAAAALNTRAVVPLALGACAGTVAIAAFDQSRTPGVAALEWATAAASILASLATFAGRVRRPEVGGPGDPLLARILAPTPEESAMIAVGEAGVDAEAPGGQDDDDPVDDDSIWSIR